MTTTPDRNPVADPLLDGPAIAHQLGISPVTVRLWAHRGLITRRGTDRRGRTLYSYAEALRVDAAHRRAKRGRPRNSTTPAT